MLEQVPRPRREYHCRWFLAILVPVDCAIMAEALAGVIGTE